jgi:hypothetical protein
MHDKNKTHTVRARGNDASNAAASAFRAKGELERTSELDIAQPCSYLGWEGRTVRSRDVSRRGEGEEGGGETEARGDGGEAVDALHRGGEGGGMVARNGGCQVILKETNWNRKTNRFTDLDN